MAVYINKEFSVQAIQIPNRKERELQPLSAEKLQFLSEMKSWKRENNGGVIFTFMHDNRPTQGYAYPSQYIIKRDSTNHIKHNFIVVSEEQGQMFLRKLG